MQPIQKPAQERGVSLHRHHADSHSTADLGKPTLLLEKDLTEQGGSTAYIHTGDEVQSQSSSPETGQTASS